MVLGTIPDLLRLFAVPVFAWAAVRDLRTRRVPNRVWPPLLVLGVLAAAIEGITAWSAGGFLWQQFLLGAAVSVGLLVPLAYAFWMIGAFGGADAKALMVIAVVFPTVPTYELAGTVLPVVQSNVGAFGLTILTNAVIVSALYPVGLGLYNLARGDVSMLMMLGRPVSVSGLENYHGRLLETPTGRTTTGLDLDALRMYLRWRGIDLAAVRDRADELRDPASLPEEPHPPTDGAVRLPDGGTDPWGAAQFLSAIDHDAYGTDPETLRGGLSVIADRDRVWVSPGIPFFVPLFIGLSIGLTYGDLLYALFLRLGLL